MDINDINAKRLQSKLDNYTLELAEVNFAIGKVEAQKFEIESVSKRRLGRSSDPGGLLSSSAKVYDESEAYRAHYLQLSKRKAELEGSCEELKSMIRRSRAGSALKCATSDVVERLVVGCKDKFAVVCGRGIATLRQIESRCKVVIDLERATNELRVLGLPDAVERAALQLNALADNFSEEVFISDEKVVCLLLDKARLLQQTQCQYRVRIDISRAKGSCKFYGSYDDVKASIDFVKSLQGKRAEIALAEDMQMQVLQSNCEAMLRDLEERHHVQVEILKDSGRLVVLGPARHVDEAVADWNLSVENNIASEASLSVSRRFLLQCVLGSGGNTARRLQRELGVAFSAVGLDDEVSLMVQLIIQGPNLKVIKAKSEIELMHDNFTNQNFSVAIPEGCVAGFVGKKGAKIQALRLRFKDAVIELDGCTLNVKCENTESRRSIKQYVEDYITENYCRSFECNIDVLTLIRSQKGKVLRERLKELKVSCDYENTDDQLMLRGVQTGVDEAIDLLQKFSECHYSETVELDNEDRIFIQVPVDSEDSILDILESEFNVELVVNRKENSVTVIGFKDSVKDAFAAMREYLEGSSSRGTAILQMPPFVVPYLIGKEGSNSKKFEKENNVKLSFNTSTSRVRIRLNPSVISSLGREAVGKLLQRAVSAVKCEARLAPVSRILTLDAKHLVKGAVDPQLWSAFLDIAENREVAITSAFKTKICVSGPSGAVEEAYEELTQLLSGESRWCLRLTEVQCLALDHFPRAQFCTNHPDISATVVEEGLQLSGRTDCVLRAKMDLLGLFGSCFPGQLASFSVDRSNLDSFGCYKLRCWIEDETGVKLDVDTDCSCIRVAGDELAVSAALQQLQVEFLDWSGKCECIEIDAMLAKELTSVHAAVLQDFEAEMQVKIKIKSCRVMVEGSDKLTTFIARSRIEEWLESLKGTYVEIQVPLVSVGAFIGKSGVHIKQLRADTGASVDFDSETGMAKISGSAGAVQQAVKRVESFLLTEMNKRHTLAVTMPLGTDIIFGRIPKEISDYCMVSNVKLEVDKHRNEVLLRGSPEKCAEISDILLEYFENEKGKAEGSSKCKKVAVAERGRLNDEANSVSSESDSGMSGPVRNQKQRQEGELNSRATKSQSRGPKQNDQGRIRSPNGKKGAPANV